MEKLSGKTALVTGSTDGVGQLVARKLGQTGARVLVHGRDAERGTRVVADIEASGGAATFLAADLSALAEVRHGVGIRVFPSQLDLAGGPGRRLRVPPVQSHEGKGCAAGDANP
jgi:hypothetical protein